MNKHISCFTLGVIFASLISAGCETDSFVDPSRTGYFETTPSAMPILGRIDVIEQASDEPDFVKPDAEMLKPGTNAYTFSAGDILEVAIPSLIQTGQTEICDRIIDQSGDIQLPVIDKVRAAGRTIEELQEDIKVKLKVVITNPQAFVSLKEGRTFQYRVLGSVDQPGIFALTKPDFRLLDALATARGASINTVRILITRTTISEENKAEYDRKSSSKPADSATTSAQNNPVQPDATATGSSTATSPPTASITAPSSVDIDQLIDALPGSTPQANQQTPPPSAPPASDPATSPASEPTTAPTSEPAAPPPSQPPPTPGLKQTQLGMLRAANRQAPPVDIDQLEPAKSDDRAVSPGDATNSPSATGAISGDQYIFDSATQSWVRSSSIEPAAKGSETQPDAGAISNPAAQSSGEGLRSVENAKIHKIRNLASKEKTEVIDIDYNQLVRGNASLNIVIKPGDAVYCDSGQVGVVYIDGEISRPGVYNLPTAGRLTLSRLVAAAGGVSELAIPERCDLIRRIGSDKEACVRISLLAIRNRGEPDLFLKPDDHIIVGTNFWALPLSRIRRDLSFPNSMGFQLDRNFGNDVFGAPPTGITTN